MDRTMCHYVEHPDGYEVSRHEPATEPDEEEPDEDVEFDDDYEEAEDVRIVADGGDG